MSAQRLDGGIGLGRRRGDAGLGADRHRRHVVGNRVVQVAGEPFTLQQLHPIELAQPGGGAEADGDTQRGGGEHHREAGDQLTTVDRADQAGGCHLGHHEERTEHGFPAGAPAEQRVDQEDQEARSEQLAGIAG